MKVYKIICKTTGKCYIGSTTQSLKRRLSVHILPRNKCRSKEIIDGGNYDMILLEEVEGTKLDLRKREQYYIDTIECVNEKSAYTSKEQRRDKHNAYRRRTRDISKDKLYRDNHKENSKAYYIKNKDKIRQQHKEIHQYKNSWGGDCRSNNNLLRIDVNLFL